MTSKSSLAERPLWILAGFLLWCVAGCTDIGNSQSGGTASSWEPSFIGGQPGSAPGGLCVGLPPQGAIACSALVEEDVVEDTDGVEPEDSGDDASDASSETGDEADAGSTEEDLDVLEPSSEAGEEDATGPEALPDAKTEEGEGSSEGGQWTLLTEDATGEESEEDEEGEETGDAPFLPGLPTSPDDPPEEEESGDPCEVAPGTCLGTPAPVWELCDFQPQSCGHDQVYGLSTYAGTVTFVALFASW